MHLAAQGISALNLATLGRCGHKSQHKSPMSEHQMYGKVSTKASTGHEDAACETGVPVTTLITTLIMLVKPEECARKGPFTCKM